MALGLLAGRAHLAVELERKLARRGASAEVCAAVVGQLRELGLLDDNVVAAKLASETTQRRGWGAARVAAELRRRGAPAEAVTQSLAQHGDDPGALARAAVERWRRRNPRAGNDPLALARLARALARLGHSGAAIRAATAFDPDVEPGIESDDTTDLGQ
jgi:SOS response regulatory protein OraA/RecX